jgi:Ca2+-transporting ATPase
MLCRLGGAELARLRESVDDMASRGMRVLGVARARHDGATFPDSPAAFLFEFLGLLGFSDPLRANVPSAIAECRSANIRVIMITGDTGSLVNRASG